LSRNVLKKDLQKGNFHYYDYLEDFVQLQTNKYHHLNEDRQED
jgi:hypothetical protein